MQYEIGGKTGMRRQQKKRIWIYGILLGMLFGVLSNISVPAMAADGEEAKVGGGHAILGELPDTGYTGKIYDAMNSMVGSVANCVLGTTDGYLWIGGYDGVVRFDGTNFEKLDTKDGLTSARTMFEDSRGGIWVGTNGDGVVLLKNNKRTHYTYEDGLPSGSIRAFAEDKDGRIYIGTTAGLCRVDSKGKIYHFSDEQLVSKRILRLVTGNGGTIYGCTKDGDIFSMVSGELKEFYKSADLGLDSISTIYTDPEQRGKIYLGTKAGEIYCGVFGHKKAMLTQVSIAPLTNAKWITSVCGKIFIASDTHLGYLDGESKFHPLHNIPMKNAIEMITSDYQGNLWAASTREGVMKIVANSFTDVTALAGLEEEVVSATCLHQGLLYIGTDHGLRIVNKKNETVKNKLQKHIGDTRIRCITKDQNGNLWVCTYEKKLGLVCLTEDGKIKDYTVAKGMPNSEVRCAVATAQGRLLVGTSGGMAVLENGKIIKTFGKKDGIEDPAFLTVEEGDDGVFYAGTDGGGIYAIKEGEIQHLTQDEGLTSNVIQKIKWDEVRKLYWVITSNSVEYMKDGIITNVSSLPCSDSFDIYFDDDENLWILSSQGLIVVKAEDVVNNKVREYKTYSLVNGLTGMPTRSAFSEMDEKGNLYIACMSGVSKVNIHNFREDTAPVKVSLTGVYVGEKEILPDKEGVYSIPSGDGRIKIVPAVLDYTMVNPTVKIYMEGQEKIGVQVSRNQLKPLEYMDLASGNYVLHIDILDKDNKTVLQDEVFKIRKEPRFFEMAVFRILFAALLALVVGLIVWRVMKGTVIQRQYHEIEQAKDEAIRANTAKSRFLANMSHEIRTPINTIMGMDEMILREDIVGVPKHYYMSVINYAIDIRMASESLLGLINDLLDMSKIESGKMHLVEQEYDTVEWLRAIVSMIRVRSDEKDLSFEVHIDENLPKRLYGDDGKIKQIVLNLLTNAVKYTENGGFTLTVKVEETDGNKCNLRISVKDTGIGVKPEDMEKLFMAYERLDEQKNSGIQGTGLGLDISKRFAELMNGNLWCESEYGSGSEFIFTLQQGVAEATPIGEFSEHDDEKLAGPYMPQFVAPDAEILVVDDNPMNLTVIKGLLKPTRIFISTASSGEECLEKIKHGSYYVVLLDHMMPGMDGLETVARIRETHPDLPVYALTANASAGGDEFYKSKGFQGYLPKPIDSKLLERTIMKHLPEEIMMKPGAEDAVEAEELPDEMAWVKEVEEISVEDGIRYSGGVTTYVHSLQDFYDTIMYNSNIIEQAYKDDDIRLYTVKVHALKTSARIIGASELSGLAERLEEAGKNEDMKFIDANWEKLLADYRAFLDKLEPLGKPEEDNRELIPEGELADAYDAMREFVPHMDYDSAEMVLEQVLSYRLPEEEEKIWQELLKALKLLQWEKMEELLGK